VDRPPAPTPKGRLGPRLTPTAPPALVLEHTQYERPPPRSPRTVFWRDQSSPTSPQPPPPNIPMLPPKPPPICLLLDCALADAAAKYRGVQNNRILAVDDTYVV